MDNKFPEPKYNIRESVEGNYSIMIVDTSLKNYKYKNAFPWYLWISIEIKNATGINMLPTDAEAKVLNELEDMVINKLKRAVLLYYIGRVTSEGYRALYIYMELPERANDIMQGIINDKPVREFVYIIEEDPEWKSVDGFYNYSGDWN